MSVSAPTMKLHLGCGTRMLEGWANHDRDVDLRKPLPWRGVVATHVYLEHVIEHLSVPHVIRLLSECRRVMGGRGVIRLAFPDPTLVRWDPHPLRELMTSYGHVSAWCPELAYMALKAAGFARWCAEAPGHSEHEELRGLEQDRPETSVVEGWE